MCAARKHSEDYSVFIWLLRDKVRTTENAESKLRTILPVSEPPEQSTHTTQRSPLSSGFGRPMDTGQQRSTFKINRQLAQIASSSSLDKNNRLDIFLMRRSKV